MFCPKCNNSMVESYDAKTRKNRMFECEECGFSQNAFDAYASSEGYPADDDEFEEWHRQRGL
jgi:DNA-directed RNA polymerase subunit M/transcription elongation factor TFIIS